MQLAGIHRQLSESKEALEESIAHAEKSAFDPAYRAALKSRNLLFHATRGLAAARGQVLPEMPVVAGKSGSLEDAPLAKSALDHCLSLFPEPDLVALDAALAAAREPFSHWLHFLREEVGKALRQ
jgi:hypothetical protein